MSLETTLESEKRRRHVRTNVVLGALLMVATLPGRTHGLGLVTEPMLEELALDRVRFATLNLWASLLGAVVCLPAGWLIDRVGLRPVSFVLLGGVALSTLGLSFHSGGIAMLFLWISLSRAFGQSGLSVAAIASVAKAGSGRNGPALGVFSVILSVLFALAFVAVGASVVGSGWRHAWREVAGTIGLLVLPLAIVFLREPPGEAGSAAAGTEPDEGTGLFEALRTPLFWIGSGAVAAFAFASSGLGLFNEVVLAEVGHEPTVYHLFLAVTTGFSLLGQFLCGWLSARKPLPLLLGMALAVYAFSLALLVHARHPAVLWSVAGLMGLSAGFVTVLFFAIWGDAYGRRELGRIQGVAQGITVLASALGPRAFATVQRGWGSYAPALYGLGLVALVFAVAAFVLPRTVSGRESNRSGKGAGW